MAIPHLVLSGARRFLAQGDDESLHAFETRVEDAIGHVFDRAKVTLLDDISQSLASADGDPERRGRLLDYLTRQRRVVQGTL